MADTRNETDSLGVVEVPAEKLWGAQIQRSLEHFSIGTDLIPREMITAYSTLKKAAAIANRDENITTAEQANSTLRMLAAYTATQFCEFVAYSHPCIAFEPIRLRVTKFIYQKEVTQ